MMGGEPEAAIVRVNWLVPVPALFVAPSATTNVPVAVGVPLITPVAALRVSPAGSPVAVKLVAEPVFAIV